MRGLYWIIPVAISIAGLPLVCESSSGGNDYWLLYQETLEGNEEDKNYCERIPNKKKCDSLFKYKYMGYHLFLSTENNDPLSIEEKYKEASENITKGKPVVNRNDDTHVVVMSLRTDTLECTKNDEIFKQVDAAVVSPTILDGKVSAPNNQKATKEIPKVPKPFVCDLETRDKGNTKITYTVNKPGNIESSEPPPSPPAKAENPEQKTKPLLQGQIRVHELYRFRIIAGPVFSSLSAKNRSYSTIINAGGQSVISSSKNNDLPVSLPVFLKVYLAPEGRDILEKPNSILERFSAIVGVNLVDNPLKNFYLGLSLETFPGVDIVGGAHFAKITQLAGGFVDGQEIAAGATPPTSDKFLTGGFVGITADVGVIGSWLGSTITKTIKDGFK